MSLFLKLTELHGTCLIMLNVSKTEGGDRGIIMALFFSLWHTPCSGGRACHLQIRRLVIQSLLGQDTKLQVPPDVFISVNVCVIRWFIYMASYNHNQEKRTPKQSAGQIKIHKIKQFFLRWLAAVCFFYRRTLCSTWTHLLKKRKEKRKKSGFIDPFQVIENNNLLHSDAHKCVRWFFFLKFLYTCTPCRLGALRVFLVIVGLQDVTVLGHHEDWDEVDDGKSQKLSLLTVLLKQTTH